MFSQCPKLFTHQLFLSVFSLAQFFEPFSVKPEGNHVLKSSGYKEFPAYAEKTAPLIPGLRSKVLTQLPDFKLGPSALGFTNCRPCCLSHFNYCESRKTVLFRNMLKRALNEFIVKCPATCYPLALVPFFPEGCIPSGFPFWFSFLAPLFPTRQVWGDRF